MTETTKPAPRKRSPRLTVVESTAEPTAPPAETEPEFLPPPPAPVGLTMDNQPAMVSTRIFYFGKRKIHLTTRRAVNDAMPLHEHVSIGRETIRHFIYACRMLEQGQREVLDPAYKSRTKTYGPTPFGESRVLCFGPVDVSLPGEVTALVDINKCNENTTAQDILDSVWLTVDITTIEQPTAKPKPATMKPKGGAVEDENGHDNFGQDFDDNGTTDNEDW